MKRVIVICEGPTEIEFCKDVLYPHFIGKNISIRTPLIKKSGGGIVAWSVLKKQIENHLLQDGQSFVTTLIDFYGILDRHAFPNWESAQAIPDKNHRMHILESSMYDFIREDLRHRYIPYIQLHEFEGLLFNDIDVFTNQIPLDEFKNLKELTEIIANYPNPELINDTLNDAPSFRLKRLITGYNKIVYGAILAKEIGLRRIRMKCPRFNEWIQKLEQLETN